MNSMMPNSIEFGERFGDNTGWARRVSLDKQKQELQITLNGKCIEAHPRDLQWLIEALQSAHEAVYGAS